MKNIYIEKNNPCWKNHKMIGMKNKNGKNVPNCVPIDEVEYSISESINLISMLKESNVIDEYIYIVEYNINEAEYKGRKVKLNKPMRGDVKKFKVYVKDPKTGNVKKVNFGHGGSSAKSKGEKTMKIKKSNPERRRSFRARHNCDNPGPKTKARYWSCKKW